MDFGQRLTNLAYPHVVRDGYMSLMNSPPVSSQHVPNDPATVVLALSEALRTSLQRIADREGRTLEFAIVVILAERVSVLEHEEWLKQTFDT